MEKNKKIMFFDKCILLIMLFVVFYGRNVFSYIKIPIMLLFIGIPILKMCITKDTILLLNNINKIWISIGIYFLIGLLYTYNIRTTLIYTIPIVIGIIFLLFKNNKNLYINFIDIVVIVSIIFAISNILSSIVPEFVPKFFSFFVKITDDIYVELAGRNYSGLAGEKAVSAFILNLGIGIIYSNIIAKGKINRVQLIQLIILFFGIFLTGKRTLTAMPLLLLLVIYTLSNEKNKSSKMFKVATIIIIAIIILMMFSSSTFHVFERFLTADLNGREELWENCLIMFKEAPILRTRIWDFQ